MTRRKWIFKKVKGSNSDDRVLVEVDPGTHQSAQRGRAFDQFSTDEMSAKSQFDGKHYESKSRYRSEMKARGLFEVGNTHVENKRPEPSSAIPDLKKAAQQIGYDL